MDIHDFRWIEYAVGKQHTDLMIRWEDLEKYRKQSGDEPQFISRYMYDRDNPYCGPMISNLYADFDCQENLKLAKAEAAHFVAVFLGYGTPEKATKIRFTGGKGFSVEIAFQCFGIEPNEFLPMIFHEMIKTLKDTYKWKTIDTSVYHRRALWRLTNTKHDKTGLHKIPLRYHDLKETDIDTIKQIAQSPQPYGPYRCDIDEDFPRVPSLVEMYEKHMQRVMSRIEKCQDRLRERLPDEPKTFDSSKIWYCVNERIKRGWKEPGRRPTAFFIAVAMKRLGANEEQVMSYLLEYAKNCEPPLDLNDPIIEKDLHHAIEMAFKNPYVTHCGTPCFSELCNKNKCWLHADQPNVKVFPPEILRLAKEKLCSPDLERWTQETYEQLICREKKNRMVLHYYELTGKMKDPSLKLIILLKGEPGGGKTRLANKTSELHRTFKRGRFSEHAIDFLKRKLDEYDLLYLMEIVTLGGEQHGISTLKFLGGDDQGYTVEITQRDKSGNLTTQEHKIPAMTVIVTTVDVQVEKQFERRAVVINVDDSPEQTRAILQWKAKKHKDKIFEKLGSREVDPNPRILEAAISLIEDCDVAVLFSETVTKLFQGEQLPLRVRGDFDKIMTLTMMRAAYHQFQRAYSEGKEKKLVYALPEDFVKGLLWAEETILQMTTGAEKRIRDAIPFVLQLKDKVTTAGKDQPVKGFAIEDLRKIHRPPRTSATIRNILRELTELGIMRSEKYGTKYIYSIINEKDLSGFGGTKIAEILRSLIPELEKEFEAEFSKVSKLQNVKTIVPDSLKSGSKDFWVCDFEIKEEQEKQPEFEKGNDETKSVAILEASNPGKLEEWKEAFPKDEGETEEE
jgi:predicted transcriptional regulator